MYMAKAVPMETGITCSGPKSRDSFFPSSQFPFNFVREAS